MPSPSLLNYFSCLLAPLYTRPFKKSMVIVQSLLNHSLNHLE